MQQHRQPQQHDQIDRQPVPRRNQVLEPLEHELAPMRADQAREQPLLLAREARHVGVLEQVGAVAVVAVVRDVEPDLVQPRRPVQRQLGERILEPPRARGPATGNCSAVASTRSACSRSSTCSWKIVFYSN